MTFDFRVRAVLTDIEGTTTSLSFVKDVLFPYARASLPAYAAAHPEELAGTPVDTLIRWIDEDRKEPILKSIQGRIWAEGYRSGAFHGHVYPDAAAALRGWHAQGIALYVYSSGSVAAQKLLYGHSDAGDLTPLFSGWFDLDTGSKLEAASYRRIAETIGGTPGEILFLSDNPGEISAARAAGLEVLRIDRQGPHDFGEIRLERAS